MSSIKCQNLPSGKEGARALVPALVTEFIGTFFLVLTVYLAVGVGEASMAPLAIGTSLAVMVYMGGHISGAHYNPAVTIGLALTCRSKLASTWVQVVSYIGVQLLGGIIAAAIGHGLTYDYTVGSNEVMWSPAPGARGVWPALVAEVIFTFALVTVVLNVATTETSKVPGKDGNTPNHFFGFAIGSTLFVGATAIGPISGCVINPAVGTGLILVEAIFGSNASVMANIWLYWVGPLAGAGFAACVYFLTNPREYACEKADDAKV